MTALRRARTDSPRRSMREMTSPVRPAATPSGFTITNDRSVIRILVTPRPPPAGGAAGVAGGVTGRLGELARALALARAALRLGLLLGDRRPVDEAHAELQLGQAQVEVADVVHRRHPRLAQRAFHAP